MARAGSYRNGRRQRSAASCEGESVGDWSVLSDGLTIGAEGRVIGVIMQSEQIQEIIPNRPPYLWVDEVVSYDEKRIHTRKFLPASLPVFQGHYPDFPVFPAALQCECAYQASAILIALLGVSTDEKVPVVARSNNQKFRRIVRPEDTLDVHVSLENRVKDVFFLKGRILSVGETVATLDFVTTATDPPETARG
jgi:3-hydroxyacyl-[acyl-carrier-protein] dehydratase